MADHWLALGLRHVLFPGFAFRPSSATRWLTWFRRRRPDQVLVNLHRRTSYVLSEERGIEDSYGKEDQT
jgi:hypothetical protein